MNALSVALLLVAVACVNAGIIAGGIGLAGVDSGAILAGPGGTVIRSGLGVGLAAPALAAAPLGLGLVGHAGILAVPAGSGLEGQWIPDINEKLYDDGSYKPHVYGL